MATLKAIPSNGYDLQQRDAFLEEFEQFEEELVQLRIDHMNAAKPVHEKRRTAFLRAKEAGFPMRAFRVMVKNHLIKYRAAKQIANNEDGLEADEAAEYEQVINGLGSFAELPLGAAAVARASERAKPKGEQIDSLTAGAADAAAAATGRADEGQLGQVGRGAAQ